MTCIGIDLGTTYSCVAVLRGGHPEIIPNDVGKNTTPSIVGFDGKETYIGQEAKNRLPFNPDNTVFDAKRLIGRKFTDVEVQKDMKTWPFKVIDGHKHVPAVQVKVNGLPKVYFAEQISALILTKLAALANKKLTTPTKKAVITVPAYFNNEQRETTKTAGIIAGLDVIGIMNEPTAAAIAFGFKANCTDNTILVYDLGGGTLDVSILKAGPKEDEPGKFEFKVLATHGNTHLGGEDFDHKLVEHCLEEIKKTKGFDLSKNLKALALLRQACEKAKITLSIQKTATIEVPELVDGYNFSLSITRSKFEDICEELFTECMEPIDEALEKAKLDTSEITDLILVGGSSRICRIQEDVSAMFDGKRPYFGLNPDEAVAAGAAIYAAKLCGKEEDDDDNFIDLVEVSEVMPLTIGIQTIGDVFSEVIPRGSKTMQKYTRPFYTVRDNQETVAVKIYEGEREKASDNHLLGHYDIKGIPPRPKGARFDLTMETDACGILHVQSVLEANGQVDKCTIAPDKHIHSEEEIQRMIREAEQTRRIDEERTNRQEAMVELQNFVVSTLGKLRPQRKEEGTKIYNEVDEWCRERPTASLNDIAERRKQAEDALKKLM